jgi:predicted Rossmann-fold nucleotide-binding protein
MVRRIVSGGQTGADRAALDAALRAGIAHGGWVPRGRKAEDGRIHARYRLREMASYRYADRTEKNVRDSDATLIVSRGPLTGGSRLTLGLARKHRKPCLHVDLAVTGMEEAETRVRTWLEENEVTTLNVAGPRASNDPGIYDRVLTLLLGVLGVRAG